ncbi:hypothetical protein LguiA_019174 [Lonicera macranthoides]
MVCVILLQACQEIHPRSARSVGSASSPRTSSVGRGGSLGEKNDNNNEQKEVGLVVCFGEMLIDFVQLSLGFHLLMHLASRKHLVGPPLMLLLTLPDWEVGEDEFGHMLADILKENNVDNSGMWFDANARTATRICYPQIQWRARIHVLFRNPSADMLLAPPELDCNLINKDEEKLKAALKFANVCGALTVTPKGAIPALPTKEANVCGALTVTPKGAIPALPTKEANVCGALTVTPKGAIPALPTKEAVLQVLNKS